MKGSEGLPGGPVVKNLPCDSGTWVLSGNYKLTCHGATKPAHCIENLCAAARESPCATTKTQHNQRKKKTEIQEGCPVPRV